MKHAARAFTLVTLVSLPALAKAADTESAQVLDLSRHWVGFAAVGIFFLAYVFAMFEESTMLRKSKPMVLAASLIWALIAAVYVSQGLGEVSGSAFRRSLEGYAELVAFILVSMTYLNAMEQRGVFDRLRIWLLSKRFGYRKLFWIKGIQSFFLSSVCNNLTTALLMGAVVTAMARDNRRFITISCVNSTWRPMPPDRSARSETSPRCWSGKRASSRSLISSICSYPRCSTSWFRQ